MGCGLAIAVAFCLGFAIGLAIGVVVVRDVTRQLRDVELELQWRRVTGMIRHADPSTAGAASRAH